MGKQDKFDKAIDDLKCHYVASSPERQIHKSYSASQIVGSLQLACRRGHQTGIHDAYEAILIDYPKAADAILRYFGMNKEGSFEVR